MMLNEDADAMTIEHVMRVYNLPHYMAQSVYGYLVHHAAPSEFLLNILQNDFVRAFKYADDTNRHLLCEWAEFCTQELPARCWGNQENVERWINKEGE